MEIEEWELYDGANAPSGMRIMRGAAIPEGCRHMVVHICLFDSKGELLIQRRQPFKSGWPGMWDVTVGGSAVAGESCQLTAERELAEEIGYTRSFEGAAPDITFTLDGVIDNIYIIHGDVDTASLSLQPEEVAEVRWASRDEILSMIDSGEFIPYEKSLISILFFLSKNGSLHTRPDLSENAGK